MIFRTNMSTSEKLDVLATLQHGECITFVNLSHRPEYMIARFVITEWELSPTTEAELLDRHIDDFLEKHCIGSGSKVGLVSVEPYQVKREISLDGWRTTFDMQINIDVPTVHVNNFRIASAFFPSFTARKLTASDTHMIIRQLFTKSKDCWIVSVADILSVQAETNSIDNVLFCHLSNRGKLWRFQPSNNNNSNTSDKG